MQRSIVCEVFDIPFAHFMSINHQCTKKHKVRVFIIIYCVKTFGGEVGGFGGKLPPRIPQ